LAITRLWGGFDVALGGLAAGPDLWPRVDAASGPVNLAAQYPPVALSRPKGHSASEPAVLPRGFGVRWLAGNGADTALDSLQRVEPKAACALTPHPPHSKTPARKPKLAPVQGRTAQKLRFLGLPQSKRVAQGV
jgi:hypothetical protein